MAHSMLQGNDEEGCLAERVSALLRQQGEHLAAEWLGRCAGRDRAPAGAGTLHHTLIRHVAPMIHAVGRHVLTAAPGPPAAVTEHAAACGLALAQSGDGLDSLDDLSALIIQKMSQEVLLSGAEYPTRSVLVVFERLAEGLRAMTSSTRAFCRERDDGEHRHQVHRLSDSALLLQHELRSCLNSILMSAEVLGLPELYADCELRGRQLAVIRSAVAHAGRLLRDADVDPAAATPPQMGQPLMVPLRSVFEAVRNELENRARAAGVTLMFQQSLPPWSIDAALARLALSNLLVNAIKYADPAKPARWATVRVQAAEGDDPAMLAVEVADNGLGIPAELQQRVLLRGVRAHPQVADGSGLGLALTREHLAQQGGSIHLASEEGIGTTVRVTLRARPIAGAGADGGTDLPLQV